MTDSRSSSCLSSVLTTACEPPSLRMIGGFRFSLPMGKISRLKITAWSCRDCYIWIDKGSASTDNWCQKILKFSSEFKCKSKEKVEIGICCFVFLFVVLKLKPRTLLILPRQISLKKPHMEGSHTEADLCLRIYHQDCSLFPNRAKDMKQVHLVRRGLIVNPGVGQLPELASHCPLAHLSLMCPDS